jgi:quinol monooxygenase YgiN
MYGLITKIDSLANQRGALIAIPLEGTAAMPGCSSHVVAKDATDADAFWVKAAWESRAQHQASLGRLRRRRGEVPA